MGPHMCPPQAVNAALLQQLPGWHCNVCHPVVFGIPTPHAFALVCHIIDG